jgi:hypothetical protein
MKVTPHVAQRHSSYAVSQRIRKRIVEAFGWIKAVDRQDKQPPLTICCDCRSSWRCQHDPPR